MNALSEPYRVGTAAITRVLETPLVFAPPSALLPDWDAAALARGADAPDAENGRDERVSVSVHTWLVRVDRHVILVDTGIGNGKIRQSPFFDRLDTPYLARLAALGVAPDNVTHVLLTISIRTMWAGTQGSPRTAGGFPPSQTRAT